MKRLDFRKKSIFWRIAISSLGLILLTTVTVSLAIISFAQNLLYKDVLQSNGALLQQIDGNATNLFQQLNTVINVSDSSLYFRTLLTEPCADQLDKFQKETEIHRFLYNYYGIFTQYKACVTVLGVNGVAYTTYDGERMVCSPEELMAETWMQPAVQTPQVDTIVYTLSHPGITTVTEGKTVILFARSLVDGYTMKHCGWLFLEIDPSGLEQLYRQGYQEGEYIFLTDSLGAVISSNRADVIGTRLEDITRIPEYARGVDTPVYTCALGDTECLAVRVPLTSIDGALIKYIETHTVSDQLREVVARVMPIAVIFCVSACLVSLLISRRITRPIARLSARMASTRYGTLPVDDTANQDELYTLETTFSNLLKAVDTYTENMRRENIARREAELNALRMQINPHFLYNTLSSFRYLIENGYDRAQISEAILQFIRLLRGTISDHREVVDLQTELDNLNAYVALMNLRYEGRIRLQVLLSDEALAGRRVPKLLLQPIAENTIFHGFPESDSMIDLSVFVCELNGTLRIEVSDNGCGIDEDTLQKLRSGSYAAQQKMSGVGLNNIDQRLKLMYGPQYGLDICSTPGSGTIVTVTLPADSGQNENGGNAS